MRTKFLALIVAAAATALAGSVQAQDDTRRTPSKPAISDGKITIEQMGVMLEELGCNPKPLKENSGKLRGYAFTYSYDGKEMPGNVIFSPNESRIFFSISFPPFDSSVSADLILNMLAQADAVYPAYFGYLPNGRKLEITMGVMNENFTKRTLQNNLSLFGHRTLLVVDIYNKAKAAAAN
jgi:hypothetical protein